MRSQTLHWRGLGVLIRANADNLVYPLVIALALGLGGLIGALI